jgi:peptidoglycan-N-acetylglucosamine deacetylase
MRVLFNPEAHSRCSWWSGFVFTLVCCLLANTQTASAETSSVLEQCWSPEQLRAQYSERRVRRRVQTYDAAPSLDGLPATSMIEAPLRGVIRRVTLPEGRKLIALTIDFCEQAGEVSGYDGEIIDYLRQQDIAATLFVGGKWLRSHGRRAQQLMADERFELANHGEAHRNFRSLLPGQRKTELFGPQAAYQSVRQKLSQRACVAGQQDQISRIPDAMTLFRFPFGVCTPQAVRAVNEGGMIAVQWDISTGDAWRGQSASRIARTVLQRVKPGSILLAHGNGRGWHTAKGLRKLIPALRQKGYRFVTVSELLAAGQPVIESRCYDTRPGDTERWARRHKHKTRKKVRQRRRAPIARPYQIP